MEGSWAQPAVAASSCIDATAVVIGVEVASRILLDSERFELKFCWKSEFLIWYDEDVNNTFRT